MKMVVVDVLVGNTPPLIELLVGSASGKDRAKEAALVRESVCAPSVPEILYSLSDRHAVLDTLHRQH